MSDDFDRINQLRLGQIEALRAELSDARKNQLDTERAYIRLRDAYNRESDAVKPALDLMRSLSINPAIPAELRSLMKGVLP